MPFHMYILNFLQCNVFAPKKLVAMTFEVTHVCVWGLENKQSAKFPLFLVQGNNINYK
jgi:hypothetical protein